MPPLEGFTNNPFKTRDDVLTALQALLSTLTPYQSPNGSLITLPVVSGTHFDQRAAQLEGYARPLWAIAALLLSSSTPDTSLSTLSPSLAQTIEPWITGLATGTDPSPTNAEYWGDITTTDQRMVEVEILAFALLCSPITFIGPPSSTLPSDIKKRTNITNYLLSVNSKPFPQTNWLWFRVMANLALVKACGVPYEQLKEGMEEDLEVLDSFYAGSGWSSDGKWCNEEERGRGGGRQMDYYAGSFAIQFSQLVYVRFAGDLDGERVERYRVRAGEFAGSFWRYFDEDGGPIPFGRSLTYRFASIAFFSALLLSSQTTTSLNTTIPLPFPLTLSHIKGPLLRSLRYWASKPHIFYPDGTLNIGYLYPNMYMSEDYNSPQSPYWCMKTLCFLSLPPSDTFWELPEAPYPLDGREEGPEVTLLKEPRHIIVQGANHHYLLSSGQFCGWPLKANQAKYSKFSYSSSFGFSVPTGPLLPQQAPDSTLAFSFDDGETWGVRWRSEETLFGAATLRSGKQGGDEERRDTLINTWTVGKRFKVTTTLIPPFKRWADWYIRLHRITISALQPGEKVQIVEGGWSIYGRTEKFGMPLSALGEVSEEEGVIEEGDEALVVSCKGGSGVRDLDVGAIVGVGGKIGTGGKGKGVILKPDANTNLMCERTVIPTVQREVVGGDGGGDVELVIVCAVFGVKGGVLSGGEIRRRWEDGPRVRFAGSGEVIVEEEVEWIEVEA